jgi:hypothetical protein
LVRLTVGQCNPARIINQNDPLIHVLDGKLVSPQRSQSRAGGLPEYFCNQMMRGQMDAPSGSIAPL